MTFQRNNRRSYRRSRSRSPFNKHSSFRRSRSPRANPRRSGPPGPRDFGRRQSYNFKERGRHDISPRRSPPRRSSPRRSRSPDRRKPIHPPKPVRITFPEDEDFERDNCHSKSFDFGNRLGIQSSAHQEDKRPYMDRVQSHKIEKRTSKKRVTLTDRFGSHQKKFELEENITIGLQRNPHVPISTVVNVEFKEFDFHKFTLRRRSDEGSKPIFDREEIKAFRHDENLDDQDDFERRVITILPSKSERRNRDASMDVDFSIRKSLSGNVHDDEDRQWGSRARDHEHSTSQRRDRDDRSSYRGEKIQITRMRTPSPRGEPQIRLDPRPDPRYEAKYRANREREEGQSHRKMERIENISQNPNDLRHSLLNRRISNPTDDARFKIELKRHDHGDQKPHHGRDAWEVASEFQRDKNKSTQRRPAGDVRNVLPDFKNREGKFEYEEWKDKPELVPKGISYFEHDNRGEEHFYNRGRGRGRFNFSNSRRFSSNRGGFRPKPYMQQFNRDKSFRDQDGDRDSYRNEGFRPRGRGSRYYGGGRGRRSSVERGEWKHDLFDKLEKDDDNCPTSTT